MEKAIKKAKRNYMRTPQKWWWGDGNDCYITHVESLGEKYIILLDKEDHNEISKYRWYMKSGYAVTSIKYKRVKMHHLIMGKPEKGFQIDHINRNKTDNRRSNLRWSSVALNRANVGGGIIRKHGNKYEANVCLDNRKFYKRFDSEEGAKNWREKLKHSYLDHLAEGKSPDSFFKELIDK